MRRCRTTRRDYSGTRGGSRVGWALERSLHHGYAGAAVTRSEERAVADAKPEVDGKAITERHEPAAGADARAELLYREDGLGAVAAVPVLRRDGERGHHDGRFLSADGYVADGLGAQRDDPRGRA